MAKQMQLYAILVRDTLRKSVDLYGFVFPTYQRAFEEIEMLEKNDRANDEEALYSYEIASPQLVEENGDAH